MKKHLYLAAALALAAAFTAGAFDDCSYWSVPQTGAAASVAVADDARAVPLNPAGLAVDHGFNGYITSFTREFGGRKDVHAYFDTPMGGFGYDWARTYDNNLPLNRRASRFTWALGLPVSRAFGLGVSVNRLAASKPYLTSAWAFDAGMLARPIPYLSLGLTANNLNEPRFLRTDQSRYYVAGIGVRPVWERLTLSGDAYWREGDEASDIGWRTGISIEMIKGLTLTGAVDDVQNYDAGLSFGLPFASAGYNTRIDKDGGIIGENVAVGFNVRPKPSLVNIGGEYVEFDVAGALNETPTGFSLLGGGGNPGTRDLLERLRRAREDDGVKVIILKMGQVRTGFGPGVSALCQDLRGEIKACRAAGKKVYAYVEEVKRPGNYYIAAAADEIVMSPWGYFGGVGTHINLWRYTGLAERFGIGFDYVTAGAYKGAFHQIAPEPTPEQKEEIQAIVDDAFGQFVRDVAADRGLDAARVCELCAGAPLTADGCKQARLVDHIYRYDDFKDYLARQAHKDEIDVDRIEAGKPWRDRWGGAGSIRVIVAAGGIERGRSGESFLTGSRVMGSETVCRQLREARKDKSVKAIVLRVDSGGGDGLASSDIYEEMKLCRNDGKVVVASMGDVAASGGYFIACGAERIFAQPATLTGSIGVVTAKPVFAGLYEKYGIDRTPITSHEHADANSPHRAWTPQEKDWVEGMIQYDYGLFLDVVAASRKIERTRLEEIARGRIYSGERAREIGLIDELGSLEDALAYARAQAKLSADAPVEFVGLRPGFWERVPGAAATLLGVTY